MTPGLAAPVRWMCAGHVLARAHRMGIDKKWAMGQFSRVVQALDLDQLAMMAEHALAGTDESFIYHLKKAGLYERDR